MKDDDFIRLIKSCPGYSTAIIELLKKYKSEELIKVLEKGEDSDEQ